MNPYNLSSTIKPKLKSLLISLIANNSSNSLKCEKLDLMLEPILYDHQIFHAVQWVKTYKTN